MTTPADDFRRVRHRHRDLAAAVDRLPTDRPRGVSRYLGQVIVGPDLDPEVPRVFNTNPASIVVDEAEGATPTVTAGAASVPVLCLGPRVPEVGDILIAKMVQGRWVASLAGVAAPPADVTVCIPCDIPNTSLTLSFTYRNTSLVNTTITVPLTYNGVAATWRYPTSGFATISDYDQANAVGSRYTLHSFVLYCLAGVVRSVTVDHFLSVGSGSRFNRYAGTGTHTCTPFFFDFGGPSGGGSNGEPVGTTQPTADVDMIASE